MTNMLEHEPPDVTYRLGLRGWGGETGETMRERWLRLNLESWFIITQKAEIKVEDVKVPHTLPNGGQTVDPCLRLTFPRTGLAGEDGVGRSIILLQFRPNLNYGLQVYSRIYTLIMRKYQYIPHPSKADSLPSQIALLLLNWSVIRQGLWLKLSGSNK